MADNPQARQEINPGRDAYVAAGDLHIHQSPSPGLRSKRLVVGDVPQEPAAFQPRAELIEALESRSGDQVRVVSAVTGIRGAGKTQVAATCARRRIAAGWRLVAWVDASNEAALLSGLAEVAAKAGIGEAGVEARELAAGVRHWLEADGDQRLLVLDNAGDLDMLRPFLPTAGSAQVIVTSVRRSAEGLGVPVPVDVFGEAEALAFLAERTGLDDSAGALELAQELGFLPLGLAQAAALIARQRLEFRVYLDRLRSAPVSKYLRRTEGDAYPYRLAEAVELSLRAMEARDPSGVGGRLMGLVAALSETGVSRGLLYQAAAAGVLGHSGQEEVDDALGDLADSSLVGFTVGRGSIVAHRLVMRVVRERLAAGGELPTVANGALLTLAGAMDAVSEPLRDPAWVRDLVGHVSTVTAGVAAHPDVFPTRMPTNLLGVRVQSLSLLNALKDSTGLAVLVAEPLAADCEQVLGANHIYTLESRANLAAAYEAVGRIVEAVPLLERTLADYERLVGVHHPETEAVRSNLAMAYQEAGRTAEAIPLLKRVLAVHELMLGADHPYSLPTRHNLAFAYLQAGRGAEAVPLLERILADRERVLGADHPDTLTTRNNLAFAYQAAGRTAEVASLLERTLADYERLLGTDHPETLTVRSNLASVYRDAGRNAEMVPHLERTLAECERVLGADHPGTLTTRSNLAMAYLEAGRSAEAVPLLERALADRGRVLGADHPHTLLSRRNLAVAYRDAGRVSEAVPLLERALADCERVLDVDHPTTKLVRDNLAELTD